MRDRFVRKMEGLVHSFEFTEAEKRYWGELKDKISEDRLYNAEGLAKLISDGWKEEHRSRADLMAKMIESSIASALRGVEKIVSTRFRKSIVSDKCIEAILGDGKKLREELEDGPKGEEIWGWSCEVADKWMTESLEELGKGMVFMSMSELARKRKVVQA